MVWPVGFLRFGKGTLATYGPGSRRIVKFQWNLKVLGVVAGRRKECRRNNRPARFKYIGKRSTRHFSGSKIIEIIRFEASRAPRWWKSKSLRARHGQILLVPRFINCYVFAFFILALTYTDWSRIWVPHLTMIVTDKIRKPPRSRSRLRLRSSSRSLSRPWFAAAV